MDDDNDFDTNTDISKPKTIPQKPDEDLDIAKQYGLDGNTNYHDAFDDID